MTRFPSTSSNEAGHLLHVYQSQASEQDGCCLAMEELGSIVVPTRGRVVTTF
jgi:hypothetical protein